MKKVITTFMSRICQKFQQVPIASTRVDLHTCSVPESQRPTCHVENFNDISKLKRKLVHQQDGSLPQQLYLNKLKPGMLNADNPFCRITCPEYTLSGRDHMKEYQLPTSSCTESRAILDISWSAFVKYRCPKSSNVQVTFDLPKIPESTTPMIDPNLTNSFEEGKQALRINKRRKLKIRTKHKKLFRKEYVFMRRATLKAKDKEKNKIKAEKIKTYHNRMKEFSAEDYIMKFLNQARRGGFRAKIFKK